MSDAIRFEQTLNREQRRHFEHNAFKVYNHLKPINENFIQLVFTYIDTPEKYNEVYTTFLNSWIKSCEWLKKKYPTITIDEHWFEKNYKPEL
jgi:hypothetical protein